MEQNKSIMVKKIRVSDILLSIAIYVSALFSVALVAGIIVYIVMRGAKMINISFLTSVTSVLNGTVGIAGNIINTLYIIVITLLIATPIGVGSAIYLNEYAKKGRFVRVVEFTTEILSGIPSIIFGLFGMVFFGETLHLGTSILTGSLTLVLMILPLITRNTQEALRAVPDSYRTGSIGMGAPKWYMIRTVLLPSALPGIITGIILAIGRIVGESAALLFTAGSDASLPHGGIAKIFGKTLNSGGTLTIQLYLSMSKAEYDVAFGIAVVLLVIILFINFLTKYFAGKFDVNKKR